MSGLEDGQWVVAADEADTALGTFMRERLGSPSWSKVKKALRTGKVFVDGAVNKNGGDRLPAGASVELRMGTPRRGLARNQITIRHLDDDVLVIDKPVDLATVPYRDQEPQNALDAARQQARRRGSDAHVRVVHRLDKATSGVLVFATSQRGFKSLKQQFFERSTERLYHAVCHGVPTSGRIESHLVEDRGDGLRGSARDGSGKRAITHVEVAETLAGASLVHVRLETGRTHQIRIHLSEEGHPLVGEPVYIRELYRTGLTRIDAPRLMLHAATLGFVHPRTGAAMRFESRWPRAFAQVVQRLRANASDAGS